MRAFAVGTLAALALFSACGGAVDNGVTSATGAGATSGAGRGGQGNTGRDGGTMGGAGAGSSRAVRDAGIGDARYVDPTCPPVKRVQGVRECDPYTADPICGPGGACTPYVAYAKRCQTEEIGTRCQTAGTGRQGDDCAASPCAAGYVCATSGAGFECVKLCTPLGAKDDCPPGLLCAPLDVDGFFVCG